jgi:large subunit ribosomal protein L9
MKLILTQEVSGLGSPGDIVDVKDGYGRNFLVPRGFAIRWTKGGERTVESIKAARSTREVRDLDHAQEVKAKLEGTTFNLPVRAGEDHAPSGRPLKDPEGRSRRERPSLRSVPFG